ncbi:hypothetical protein M438DRAFT_344352 [Aureobasidium pullulans EXF-150]|uniref:Uncharacterized protein n=1 Tax=Aureobasidium pullulans EXF-150 TaxID=1043002 RepID=A0A074XK82_AURPU|nr:uncharacterized protein M438DRAFT_344352 [Aureobasidium pullulans EXF-150]KEQ85925.1 hypothetical protein M438DRAFT_344352 [Aureobasidium pullulans EXF-150]
MPITLSPPKKHEERFSKSGADKAVSLASIRPKQSFGHGVACNDGPQRIAFKL